jgi:hypothetical protein
MRKIFQFSRPAKQLKELWYTYTSSNPEYLSDLPKLKLLDVFLDSSIQSKENNEGKLENIIQVCQGLFATLSNLYIVEIKNNLKIETVQLYLDITNKILQCINNYFHDKYYLSIISNDSNIMTSLLKALSSANNTKSKTEILSLLTLLLTDKISIETFGMIEGFQCLFQSSVSEPFEYNQLVMEVVSSAMHICRDKEISSYMNMDDDNDENDESQMNDNSNNLTTISISNLTLEQIEGFVEDKYRSK